MSNTIWIALITQLPAVIAAIGTLIVSMRTRTHLFEIHKQINSRMDQLLETTAVSAKAEGIKQESERIK